MPVNPAIRTLAQDGRITLSDANALKQAVAAGTVSQADVKDAANRYAEAIDDDAAAVLSDSFQGAGRAKLSSLPEGFVNKTLEKGMRSADVTTLQRGLMSAGLSSMSQAMALKSGADGIFGTETETSVRAFQKANGLAETGKADPLTLKALQQAISGAPGAVRTHQPANVPTPTPAGVRPSTGLRGREANAAPPAAAANAPTTTPATPTTTASSTIPAPVATSATVATPATVAAPSTGHAAGNAVINAKSTPARAAPTIGVTLPVDVKPATASAVIAAGTELAMGERAKNYGTDNPWRNIDPRHNAPVDVRMGGLTNRWKCNLFGGNALAAAGFEPPYYNNKKQGGEYPVAEQWHQWSTPSAELKSRAAAAGTPVVDHARKSRNESRFDLMDEVKPTEIADPAVREQRVNELLARVQPGDVVTVDHVGAGSDGGHVRVCIGRDEKSGKPLFAQAKSGAAEVHAEGADAFLAEKGIYILRPNTPRQ